jgi:hypothetical protein
MEGMEHLLPGKDPLTHAAAEALAQQLGLSQYALDPAGIARLSRVAAVLKENPEVVNTKLAKADAQHYFQVIHDHVEIFALDLGDLEKPANTPAFKIQTFGPPAHKPPIRCSPTHAQHMREEIALLERHGLIMKGPTPWASPCFTVPKPRSTKLRTVIDYRLLNLQTRRDSHPIPHTRDVLAKVTPFHVFCKLDLASGFWQIPMDEASIPYTGVCTPETLYMWLRLAFGLRNGPPAFQRAVHAILEAAGLAGIIGQFIDDLATGGTDHRHAAANCKKMFTTLQAANFKAGATKVFLGLEELAFLGFLL